RISSGRLSLRCPHPAGAEAASATWRASSQAARAILRRRSPGRFTSRARITRSRASGNRPFLEAPPERLRLLLSARVQHYRGSHASRAADRARRGGPMRAIRRGAGWAGVSVAFVWSVLAAQALAMIHFDIPAQPLADALRAVGSQTNTNILFDPPLVAGRSAPALKADLTTGQALAVLLTGTGLHYEFVNARTIVLTADGSRPHTSSAAPPAGAPPEPPPAEVSRPPIRPGQAGPVGNAEQSPPPPQQAPAEPVAEVTVTGSRIARPDFVSQYPIVSSSAAELRSSARVNLEGALEQMPQFLNGQGENYNAGAVGGGGRATLNLRGLGQQRTLVLL